MNQSRRSLLVASAGFVGALAMPAWGRRGKSIEDVARLETISAHEELRIQSIREIAGALERAATLNLPLTMAGARHSQGGHIAADGAIVVDTRAFNQILSLNIADKHIKVAPGATWDQVQRAVNPHGLSVAVQQSSNIFTVGGSVAVNCHGRDPRQGCIVDVVEEVEVLLADGRLLKASRSENADLFRATVGGYGTTGVITSISLKLVNDALLTKSVRKIALAEYPEWLRNHVLRNEAVQLHFGRPNVVADRLFETVTVVDFSASGRVFKEGAPLKGEKAVGVNKALMALSRSSEGGKAMRWHLQELFADRAGTRSTMTRNNAMRPEVKFLEYRGKADTDILQEYFIPLGAFTGFMNRLKKLVMERRINLLSVTLRHLRRDETTTLSYARHDHAIAVVLYINVPRSAAGQQASQAWTRELIDIALDHGGTYYLPYQRWASREQLKRGYPGLDGFLAQRAKWDPGRRFNSLWAQTYLT